MSRIMGSIHDEVDLAGHTTEYFCAEDSPESNSRGSWARFRYPMAVLRHVQQAQALGTPFDIVNVHEPSAAAVSMLRGSTGKSKVVVTSHGVEERGWESRLDKEATPEERPPLRSRIIYPTSVLWQARMGLRNCDHIFCLNEEDKQFIERRYKRNSSDITRIFPAADPIYGSKAADRDYGHCDSILFAGSWLIRKGIRILVSAFEVLADSHPHLKMIILNPGQPESNVLADFPEHLRSRLEVVRAGPDDGTAAVLERSGIFVLPSFFEGTPLTLMEAMWSGLPVVTTAVCGIKDVIEDGRNGLLVPPRSVEELTQAIQKLLKQPELRQQVGKAAHHDALIRYSWRKVAEPVLETYERLVK